MNYHDPDSLYRIFSQVIRLHYQRMHQLLDAVGIYPGQPQMLFALHMANGQSQKDLAAKLKIKPATITVMLKRMEKAGLVERRPDPTDQRVSRVYLTEAGQATWHEVTQVLRVIDKECFGNFSLEEQGLLRKMLLQLRANLSAACAKTGDELDG